MIVDNRVEIDAPAPVVWDVYADVEHWPDWTASVERLAPLDSPGIEVGKRFQLKQPHMPNLVWEVTQVDPGVSWTWRQRSPGATTIATHQVFAQGPGRTLVLQRIAHRGPIGVVVGVLMLRLTNRFLHLEAAGLKGRSERWSRQDASPV
jgi:uncharacterized membrane protein